MTQEQFKKAQEIHFERSELEFRVKLALDQPTPDFGRVAMELENIGAVDEAKVVRDKLRDLQNLIGDIVSDKLSIYEARMAAI